MLRHGRLEGPVEPPCTVHHVIEAVSHPLRIEILDVLFQNPTSVSQIAQSLEQSMTLTSQHLGRLQEAGMLAMARRKTQHIYRLSRHLRMERNERRIEIAINSTDGGSCHLIIPKPR